MTGDQWTPSVSSSGSGDSDNVHRIGITNKLGTYLRGGLPGRVGERSALPHVPGAIARSLGQRIAHCSSVSEINIACPLLGLKVGSCHDRFRMSRIPHRKFAHLPDQDISHREILQAQNRGTSKHLHHAVVADPRIGRKGLRFSSRLLQSFANAKHVVVLQLGSKKQRPCSRFGVRKLRVNRHQGFRCLPRQFIRFAETGLVNSAVARGVARVAHRPRIGRKNHDCV